MTKAMMFAVLFTMMWLATEGSAKTLRVQFAEGDTSKHILVQEVAGSMPTQQTHLNDKNPKDVSMNNVFCLTPSRKQQKRSCRCVKDQISGRSNWNWECKDNDDDDDDDDDDDNGDGWPERKENSVCSKITDAYNNCYFTKDGNKQCSKRKNNNCKNWIRYHEYCYDDNYGKVLDCNETKLNLWFVWLIIALVVVAIVVAVIVVYCCCCRRRKQQRELLQQQHEYQRDNLREQEMSEQQDNSQVPVYFDGKNVYYYPINNNSKKVSNSSDNSNNGVNVESDVSLPPEPNNNPTNNNDANPAYIRNTLPAVSSIHPLSSTVDGSVVNGQPVFSYMYNQTNPLESATMTTSDNTGHEVKNDNAHTAAPEYFEVSKDGTNIPNSNFVNTTTMAHVLRSGSNSRSEATHNNPYEQTSTNATSLPPPLPQQKQQKKHIEPIASHNVIKTEQSTPHPTTRTTANVMH